jgi:large subunit ribosomal protein L10
MSEYSVKVRPEKVQVVEGIKSELGDTQAAVLTEYRGLTVTELAQLRSRLGEAETSYRVVKNTLARRAANELGFDELEELFVGPVAVAYVRGDPVAAAKVLATFAREHPALLIKGGVLEGRVISGDEAKDLATIDALDVSRAKIAGLLEAPLRQIMFILQAPAGRILYVLEQIGARAPEAEAPAPEAEAEDETAPETEPAVEAEAEPAAEASVAEEAAPAEEAPQAETVESSSAPEAAEQQTEEETKEGEQDGEAQH